MKEKIKKIILGYLPGFITGLIICGTISVIAATYFPSNDVAYDNTESGLSSTDVQGAIDELYGVCTAKPVGDQIIEDAGLEKDPYECRYFFTGANPNNYITFNNETAGWRIISVECDGTIKIIRSDLLPEKTIFHSYSNLWSNSNINTYLNVTYFNTLLDKDKIVSHDFKVGAITFGNSDLEGQVKNENSNIWNGKLGLITVSEYIRTNSNVSLCGNFKLNQDNYDECQKTNWMYIDKTYWWTITPTPTNESDHDEFYVDNFGDGFGGFYEGIVYDHNFYVRPTFYLSSDIKITGGNGSQNNPYEISL